MSNRQQLARERLEYYLVYLILAYRRLILIVGLLLLVYALTMIVASPFAGIASFLPAIFLLLLSNSFNVALCTARLVAWARTFWRSNE